MTEDEMVRWHYQLNGHEFEQAPGDGEGQGSLVGFSLWVAKSDVTERLNNSNNSGEIPHAEEQPSLFTTTMEPLPRAWEPQLLKPAHTGAPAVQQKPPQ